MFTVSLTSPLLQKQGQQGALHFGNVGETSAEAAVRLPNDDVLAKLAAPPVKPMTRVQKRKIMAENLEKMGVNSGKPKPTAEELQKLHAFIPVAFQLDGLDRAKPQSISNQLLRKLQARLPEARNIMDLSELTRTAAGPNSGLLNPAVAQRKLNMQLFEKWGHPHKGHLTQFTKQQLQGTLDTLPLLRALDGEDVFDEKSMTNQVLRKLYPRQYGVIFYGGALKSGTEEYLAKAREFARKMGEAGYFGVTGGGSVFMEAIARGFQDADSHTVGSNIWRFNDSDVDVHREVTMYNSVPARIHAADGGYEGRGMVSVVFPGGVGTKRETYGKVEDNLFGVSGAASLRTLFLVDLNPRFTEELKTDFARMIEDGRISARSAAYLQNGGMHWIKTPDEALAILQSTTVEVTKGRPFDKVTV